MNSKNKVFLIWFIVFIALFLAASAIQHDFVINAVWSMVVILGIIMGRDLIKDAYFTLASKDWPVTKSMIKSSRAIYSSGGSDSSPHYTAKFEIDYLVQNQLYQYEFKNPNPRRFSTEIEAKDYISKVKHGQIFSSIHYNPNKPAQSYIEPSLKVHHFLGMPIAMGMIAVPVLTLLGVIHWR